MVKKGKIEAAKENQIEEHVLNIEVNSPESATSNPIAENTP